MLSSHRPHGPPLGPALREHKREKPFAILKECRCVDPDRYERIATHLRHRLLLSIMQPLMRFGHSLGLL